MPIQTHKKKKDHSHHGKNLPYTLGREELCSLFSVFRCVYRVNDEEQPEAWVIVLYQIPRLIPVMNSYIVSNQPFKITFFQSVEQKKKKRERGKRTPARETQTCYILSDKNKTRPTPVRAALMHQLQRATYYQRAG